MNCIFNCGIGSCARGQPHICRICGKINEHRSKHCSTLPCIFNCGIGSCASGRPHQCRKCGVLNNHRSANCRAKQKTSVFCLVTKQKTSNVGLLPSPVPAPAPAPAPSPVPAPSYPVLVSVTSKPEVKWVDVTVIWIRSSSSEPMILSCLRGVTRSNYGFLYTQGGSVDPGESPEHAAVREAREEAGISINEYDLIALPDTNIHSKNRSFYVVYRTSQEPYFSGPEPEYKDEVIQVSDIEGYPATQGVAWIPLIKFLSIAYGISKREYCVTINFKKIVKHAKDCNYIP